jgi:hypothetical protein
MSIVLVLVTFNIFEVPGFNYKKPTRIETDGKKLYLQYYFGELEVTMPTDSTGAPSMYWTNN